MKKIILEPGNYPTLNQELLMAFSNFKDDLEKVRAKMEDGRKRKKKGLQWDFKRVVGKEGIYQLCRGIFWHPLIGFMVNEKKIEPEVLEMVKQHYETYAPVNLIV